MRLADLAAEARVRPPWEGVDLGFVLAREWYRALVLRHLAVSVPATVLIVAALGVDSVWSLLVLWWLKPLFDAPLLVWLSRRMFGESPDWPALRAAVTPTGWRDLLGWLSFARFSPSRSFLMPVGLLESLAGPAKRERIMVLRFGASTPAWFTIACAHFELVLNAAMLMLAVMLVPAHFRATLLEGIQAGGGADWIAIVSYLLTCAAIAPFYVAGGFALYLTRRSELEAWDLELRLRRLVERRAERLRRGAALGAFLALVLAGASLPPPVSAAPLTRDFARDTATRVLARPEFGTRKSGLHWEYVERAARHEPPAGEWQRFLAALRDFARSIASLVRVLAWIGAAALVVWFLARLEGLVPGLRLPGRRARSRRVDAAALLGLPASAQPLPTDVASAARTLVAAGEVRRALALLLRATLEDFAARYALELGAGLTEAECAARVSAPASAEEAAYFRALLELWTRLAYAHEAPPPERLAAVLDAYGTHAAAA
ncbi:MAG: hypothetical protein HY749_22885 [Gammaproteobacteria bacterium]|nr:hypothetical protein [Gammaproteobacteria bacterium]MBI5617184.1 hypothetical protein [Gammaproteobacteria bacterium]